MSCTLLIKEGMGAFTDTEVRLAKYLLDHSRQVPHMSAKEFSAACGASPAAAVRFSQKLGFSGFTDLKLDLARESGHGEGDDFQTAIRESDTMEALVQKAEAIHLRNTSNTFRMIQLPVLTGAIQALRSARRVHLFGSGASGLMAMDFLHKCSRIGLNIFYHVDAHTNLAAAPLLGPQDTVVAISYSGETRETLLAVRAASEHGARVIAITQANRNSLSKLADYPLYIPSEEQEFRVGAMTSRTSTLLVLDLLYLGLARFDPQHTEVCLRDSRDIIHDLQGKRK